METLISRAIKSSLEMGYKIISFWIKLWLVPLNSIIEWCFDRIVPVLMPLVNWVKQNKSNLLKLSIYSILLLVIASILSTTTLIIVYSNRVSKGSTEAPLYFDFANSKKNQVTASSDISADLYKNRLYDVFLELELPESPRNMEMGMFMVCMVINNNEKWSPNVIHNYCKPALLKYTSPTLKTIRNYVNIVPFLFGLYEEKQTLLVPMVENLLSTRYYHTISVDVTILNADIQVYSASVKIIANLQGLEYYLYHYPITMFIICWSILFIMWFSSLVFVVACVYLYRFFNRAPVRSINELDDGSEDEIAFNEDEEDNINDFFEQPIGDSSEIQSNAASSSSKKKFVWEEDDKKIIANTVNNDNNNNNNNATSSNSLYQDDDINSFLKREQKKYEELYKQQTTTTTEIIKIEPTVIVEDTITTPPLLSTENFNSNNSPQAINDDDLSSSSSTISDFSSSSFSPLVPSDNEDNNNDDSNNDDNNNDDSNNDDSSTTVRKRK